LREIENSFRVRDSKLQSQCFKIDIFVGAIAAESEPFDSKLRNAFCSASLNVRPIAIARRRFSSAWSNVESACGNFSKVNRGTLTTQ